MGGPERAGRPGKAVAPLDPQAPEVRGPRRSRGALEILREPPRSEPVYTQDPEEADAEGWGLPGDEAAGVLRKAVGQAEAKAGAGAQEASSRPAARPPRGGLTHAGVRTAVIPSRRRRAWSEDLASPRSFAR